MKKILSFALFESKISDEVQNQINSSQAFADLAGLGITGFFYSVKRNGTIDFGRSIGSATKISIENSAPDPSGNTTPVYRCYSWSQGSAIMTEYFTSLEDAIRFIWAYVISKRISVDKENIKKSLTDPVAKKFWGERKTLKEIIEDLYSNTFTVTLLSFYEKYKDTFDALGFTSNMYPLSKIARSLNVNDSLLLGIGHPYKDSIVGILLPIFKNKSYQESPYQKGSIITQISETLKIKIGIRKSSTKNYSEKQVTIVSNDENDLEEKALDTIVKWIKDVDMNGLQHILADLLISFKNSGTDLMISRISEIVNKKIEEDPSSISSASINGLIDKGFLIPNEFTKLIANVGDFGIF